MGFSEKKRMELESKIMSYRYRDKDSDQRKTYDEVFDEKTLMTLYKLMTNNVIDVLDFPLATGKEGNVFRANTIDGKRLAVKIYRVSNSTFKNIQKYIQGDRRFRGVGKNHRRGIYMWAQKEFRNLDRMHENGIRVPRPVFCENNVVVMEYIGTKDTPARHMKDVELEDPEAIFTHLVEQMRMMYQDADLVHCDLSEYNILMLDGEPVIIDVGQAVLVTHPMAQEFLIRDINNITHFFNKHGVESDKDEVLKMIKGDA